MQIKVSLCVALLFVLSGCAVAPPVPNAARLGARNLVVDLSDGTTCRVLVGAPVGAGPLCATGYSYRVEPVQNPNLLRKLAQGAAAALGAEGALTPMAQVILTAPSGREYRFVSPPPLQ